MNSFPRNPWTGFVTAWLIALAVYLANGRATPGVDTVPARHLALSLVGDGNLTLDEFRGRKAVLGLAEATRESAGHLVSDFPPGTGIAAAPFFGLGRRMGLLPDGGTATWLEKWAAANLAALAAGAMWTALARTGAPRGPRALAWIAYTFGSPAWMVSSQGLWPHAPLAFLTATALAVWPCPAPVHGKRWVTPARFAACGFLIGLGVIVRPTAAVILAAFAAAPLLAGWQARKIRRGDSPRSNDATMSSARHVSFDTLAVALGGAVGIVPFFLYQSLHFGTPVGGGYLSLMAEGGYFAAPWNLVANLSAHLISPGRGLLVFCPFVVLAVWAWPRARFAKPAPAGLPVGLCWMAVLALAVVVLAYRKWWSGWGWGPRYWADAMPFLVMLTLPALTAALAPWNGPGPATGRRRLARVGAVGCVAWAVGLQALGAWRYDGGWDEEVDVDAHPAACWRVADSSIAYALTAGRSHARATGADTAEAPMLGDRVPLGPVGPLEPLFRALPLTGFHPPEPWGVATRGGLPATIRFRTGRPGGGRLGLWLFVPTPSMSPARLRFSINGSETAVRDIPGVMGVKWEAPMKIEIPAPAEAMAAGNPGPAGHRLTIEGAAPAYVREGSRRCFGVGLVGVMWMPDGP